MKYYLKLLTFQGNFIGYFAVGLSETPNDPPLYRFPARSNIIDAVNDLFFDSKTKKNSQSVNIELYKILNPIDHTSDSVITRTVEPSEFVWTDELLQEYIKAVFAQYNSSIPFPSQLKELFLYKLQIDVPDLLDGL